MSKLEATDLDTLDISPVIKNIHEFEALIPFAN